MEQTIERDTDRLGLALLGFAVALAVFLLLPPFIGGQVGPIEHFTGQEAADLFTPIVTMPLAALVFDLLGRSSLRLRLLFITLVAAWVLGQGLHLGTNALGDVFKVGPERDAFYATPVGKLDHWLDETLSHWIWHLAWVGLLVLFVVGARTASRDAPPAGRRADGLAAAAGAVHGFTWLVVTVEGDTALLGIPAAALFLVLGLIGRRSGNSSRTLATFLVAGSVLALVCYGLWLVLYGWPMPAFTDKLKILP